MKSLHLLKQHSNTFPKAKILRFSIEMDEKLPESLETDVQRLNQILKNLLSNAFKFTEKGEVKFRIYEANQNWKQGNPSLDNAKRVVAFEIRDTGIGISKDKQNIIFEAFQQAEGSTSRKYGGTGLGLSISRGLQNCWVVLLNWKVKQVQEVHLPCSCLLSIILQYYQRKKNKPASR